MKAKKILTTVGRIVLFLAALHLSASYLGLVLFHMMGDDYATYYLGQEPRNTAETVFVGSSHQFCSVDVNILTQKYGMNSILLTSSGQDFMLSYYAIMAAIELQHPSTIVLETFTAANKGEETNTMAKAYFLFNLPNWTKTKYEAVRDIGEPAYLYYYPVTSLHKFWTSFEPSALIPPKRLRAGEHYCYRNTTIKPLEPWTIADNEKKGNLKDRDILWMKKIMELCQENHMELILYTAPYAAQESEQAVFHAFADFAEENGLRYYNFLDQTDEIGLDLSTDYMDEGHLNRTGQEKFTKYLAEHVFELSVSAETALR